VIGANGSGKTTLANSLKKVLTKEKQILIAAQKVIFISPFKAYENTEKELKSLQDNELCQYQKFLNS